MPGHQDCLLVVCGDGTTGHFTGRDVDGNAPGIAVLAEIVDALDLVAITGNGVVLAVVIEDQNHLVVVDQARVRGIIRHAAPFGEESTVIGIETDAAPVTGIRGTDLLQLILWNVVDPLDFPLVIGIYYQNILVFEPMHMIRGGAPGFGARVVLGGGVGVVSTLGLSTTFSFCASLYFIFSRCSSCALNISLTSGALLVSLKNCIINLRDRDM